MVKRMLIDAEHKEETRVSIVDGNRLEDFDFESKIRKQIKGNIYLAKVTRVEPSLQAAFVEYGGNRHGFLAFSEIHPDYYRIPIEDRQALIDEEHQLAEQEAREDEELDQKDKPVAPSGDDKKNTRKRRPRKRSSSRNEIKDDTQEVSEDSKVTTKDDETQENLSGDTDKKDDSGDTKKKSHGRKKTTKKEDVDKDSSDKNDDSDSTSKDDTDDTQKSAKNDYKAAVKDSDDAVVTSDDEPQDDNKDDLTDDNTQPDVVGSDKPPAKNTESVGGEEVDVDELTPRHISKLRRRYKIQEVIKRSQIMLVQITKEERGNKGAAMTTYISLPGRYCVLMPNSPRGGGISRKISNPNDRRKMRDIINSLDVPKGMSVILRTAGLERTKTEIKRDYDYLIRLWDDIRKVTLESMAPALVYEEGDLIKRSVRDLYSRDIDEVMVAGDDAYRTVKDLMKSLIPSHAKRVKPYKDEAIPLFQRYQVESQIDAIFNSEVRLKSGGSIVINPTEALVSIDVNSGKSTRERHIDETALKTNLEAAEEIARQLRLRDLGGLVVVDFIDMENSRHNAKVERRMKEVMSGDRARVEIGRLSNFGLLEMSRQRLRPSLLETHFHKCAACDGMGLVRTVESAAVVVLRAIEEEGIRARAAEIAVNVPADVALYILNHKRDMLAGIEQRYNVAVFIRIDDILNRNDYDLNFSKERSHIVPEAAKPAINNADVRQSADDAHEKEQADHHQDRDDDSDDDSRDDDSSDDDSDDNNRNRRSRRSRGGRNRGRGGRNNRGGRDHDASQDDQDNNGASDKETPADASSEDTASEKEKADDNNDDNGRERHNSGGKRRGGRSPYGRRAASRRGGNKPYEEKEASSTQQDNAKPEIESATKSEEKPAAKTEERAVPKSDELPKSSAQTSEKKPPAGVQSVNQKPEAPKRGWWQKLVD